MSSRPAQKSETTPLLQRQQPQDPTAPHNSRYNQNDDSFTTQHHPGEEGEEEEGEEEDDPPSPPSPSFTPKSLLTGLLLGTLLCHANIYYGLRNGFSDPLSQETVLLGYGILQSSRLLFGTSFTPAENVLVSTVAGAMGLMPNVAGVVSALMAVERLNSSSPSPSPFPSPLVQEEGKWTGWDLDEGKIVLWGVGAGLFALPFIMLFRRYFVDEAGLPWPSAKAAGTLVNVVHGTSEKLTGREAVKRPAEGDAPAGREDGDIRGQAASDVPEIAELEMDVGPRILLWSFAIASLLTTLTSVFPILKKIPIFGGYMASKWYWAFSVSPGVFGQGMVTGPLMTSHMLMGAIVGWGILTPLASSQGWTINAYDDWQSTTSSWTSWIALSILVTDSMVQLVWLIYERVDMKTLHKLSGEVYQRSEGNDHQQPLLDRSGTKSSASKLEYLLSNSLVLSGLTLAAAMLYAGIVAFDFAGRVFLGNTIIAIVMSLLLSTASVRVLAMGDQHPVGGLARLSQVIIAVIVSRINPNHLLVNVILGAIVHAGAAQAASMMFHFKIASVVDAKPVSQLLGQAIGTIAGALVSALFVKIYTGTYKIPSTRFQAPAALEWMSTAKSVYANGLPPFCFLFSVVFAIVFALLAVIRIRFAKSPWHRFIPGGIAFAIGMYTIPAFTLPRVLGAMVFWYAQSQIGVSPKTGPFLASGLNLGESLFGLLGVVMPS